VTILIVANPELIKKMREIIGQVSLKTFNPDKYPNPGLQWHFRILQAIALDEELPELPEDKTIPNYRKVHERVGSLAFEWADILDKEEPAGRVEPSKKRKAINGAGNGVEDKVKREKKSVEPTSGDKIESLYEQGNLMTVYSLS
jgi:ATP-dependent DNA helicase 2 subunit 1